MGQGVEPGGERGKGRGGWGVGEGKPTFFSGEGFPLCLITPTGTDYNPTVRQRRGKIGIAESIPYDTAGEELDSDGAIAQHAQGKGRQILKRLVKSDSGSPCQEVFPRILQATQGRT
jgi:hypothetical protein